MGNLQMHWKSRNSLILKWCERGELNPYGFTHWILSPARLPGSATLALLIVKDFSAFGQTFPLTGKDSNTVTVTAPLIASLRILSSSLIHSTPFPVPAQDG